MNELHLAVKVAMYAVMGMAAAGAVGAVTARSIFHSALSLIVTLMGIAAIYVSLEAEFLAAVQILIYVGAVMTLVIFAIMMTEKIGDTSTSAQNGLSVPAIAATLGLLGILTSIILSTPWTSRVGQHFKRVTVMNLGEQFLGHYVFPFEVVSVFLIAALIGAVIIAKKDKS